MDYKPNDFFVGVIDFFGILVPGAVLVFLHGDFLLRMLGIHGVPADKVTYWAGFLIASLLIGHFLTGTSILLLNWSYGLSIGNVNLYYKEAEKSLAVPVVNDRKAAYNRAYAYIRLNSAAGILEVDRQVAEFKLFRALAVAFVIDLGFAIVKLDALHIATSLVFALLSWYRFASLVCWTQQTTFEYYVLLTKAGRTNVETA